MVQTKTYLCGCPILSCRLPKCIQFHIIQLNEPLKWVVYTQARQLLGDTDTYM